MKIKFWKYDYKDAMRIKLFLEALGYTTAGIIGGVWSNGHSNNDIDIYIPSVEISQEHINKIMKALGTNKHEITDWGSLYLPDTLFGTLDIFFKGQTDDFDY